MDAAGVARTVLVQASTCYGHDNSYVADAVTAHPDRFTGVCSVDTLESDAVAVLKHWLESGITGLRIFTTGSNMGGQQLEILDDPRSFPVWDYVQQIGVPVCLQMTATALPQVEMLAQRFPRVRILLDHFARPDLADGPPYARAASLWALARFPNIYLKASPHTFAAAKSGQATPASFFRRAVDEFGAQRIFWGSNFPGRRRHADLAVGAGTREFRHAFGRRAGLDFLEDRAVALSGARQVAALTPPTRDAAPHRRATAATDRRGRAARRRNSRGLRAWRWRASRPISLAGKASGSRNCRKAMYCAVHSPTPRIARSRSIASSRSPVASKICGCAIAAFATAESVAARLRGMPSVARSALASALGSGNTCVSAPCGSAQRLAVLRRRACPPGRAPRRP